MTFHGLYGIPHRSWGSEEVEQNEEKIRENIETLTRQNPLLGKTLDLMMDYSNYHDSITFEMAYNDAQVLIDRSRANLEADLRNCVEEVRKKLC